jgi:hypothetical protein
MDCENVFFYDFTTPRNNEFSGAEYLRIKMNKKEVEKNIPDMKRFLP